MKKRTLMITFFIVSLSAAAAMAMQGHDSGASGGGHDMHADQQSEHGAHGKDMQSAGESDTFKHHASEDGMDADFQVMSLASMNMASDDGESHHIMVNLTESGDRNPVKDAVGKIKVIGPDGKEQTSALKNYNGILAANFNFDKPGKYGVICLVKSEDKKHVFKFWYHHM